MFLEPQTCLRGRSIVLWSSQVHHCHLLCLFYKHDFVFPPPLCNHIHSAPFWYCNIGKYCILCILQNWWTLYHFDIAILVNIVYFCYCIIGKYCIVLILQYWQILHPWLVNDDVDSCSGSSYNVAHCCTIFLCYLGREIYRWSSQKSK